MAARRRMGQMERQMEGGGGGRFCGRGPLPMIECKWGAGGDGRCGRPAWARPETGARRGLIGSLGPLWVGFPGHGGLRPGAGRVELHALIIARAFYGSKCGRGGSEPTRNEFQVWRAETC